MNCSINYRKNCSMKKITVLTLLLTCSAASWAGEKENTDNQEVSEHKQIEESKRSAWNKYLHGYEY